MRGKSGHIVLFSSTADLMTSHYVAFVRTMLPEQGHEGWVLFNDEKVVKAVDIEDMKKSAYVYFFERT